MKYYINTPIYYVNDKPHIGHAYTTIVADALARFHRLKKEEVFFSVGVDENSQKNIQAMEKAGESDLQTYLDRMAGVWKTVWQEIGISFDDFIRTTDERHVIGVNRFWEAVKKNGDIELRDYESWYCVGCEAFKVESDLVNDRCPLHPNKDIDRLKEKNYFFKLSKYRQPLLKLIDETEFVQPESRRNEIRNYVADHLEDISISREAKSLKVGIPVPEDESQRIYVWFDALLNYLTVVGYGTDEALFKKWWPTDFEPLGKDIIKFHGALFPAMIMSAAQQDPLLQDKNGQPLLVKHVFSHGFFTVNGQKMSKSIGNVVDPVELSQRFGNDALRYFLLREIPFGEDGDFSEKRFEERYQADLGNTLGNLVNRVIAMSKKYFEGKTPNVQLSKPANKIAGGLSELKKMIEQHYAQAHCDQVLETIWSSLFQANKHVEETQPFKLIKTDPEAVAEVLYELLESCRWYAWMIAPIMPETTNKIFTQLGLDAEHELSKGWDQALIWGQLESGSPLGDPQPLFPRKEVS
ncbi:methionine--tRNA ligase [Candidatus Uhrbacteria bacterium]|nr:methionine--tRNA ligase [Candidatus Uhrbacteria bacterium]